MVDSYKSKNASGRQIPFLFMLVVVFSFSPMFDRNPQYQHITLNTSDCKPLPDFQKHSLGEIIDLNKFNQVSQNE